MDPVTNGSPCLRYGPLPDGDYLLTAAVFSAVETGDEDACSAPWETPTEPCLVGTAGSELTAQANTTSARGEIVLVFTD